MRWLTTARTVVRCVRAVVRTVVRCVRTVVRSVRTVARCVRTVVRCVRAMYVYGCVMCACGWVLCSCGSAINVCSVYGVSMAAQLHNLCWQVWLHSVHRWKVIRIISNMLLVRVWLNDLVKQKHSSSTWATMWRRKWFVLIWSDFDSCDLCTNSWRHWHWQHQCVVVVSEWSLDYRLKKIYNLQIRILNLEPWMFSEFEFDCCETLRRFLQGCSRPGSPVLLVVCSREYLNPWTSNWNRRCGFSGFILTILLRTASHTRRAKLV